MTSFDPKNGRVTLMLSDVGPGDEGRVPRIFFIDIKYFFINNKNLVLKIQLRPENEGG